MRKKAIYILFISLVILTACGSGDSKEESMMDSSGGSEEFAVESEMNSKADSNDSVVEIDREDDMDTEGITTNRMIIHQAQLHVEVENLEKAQLAIEKKVIEYGGYVVESNVYKETERVVHGQLIVRIPEKHFQQFLLEAEGAAAKIIERNVTGQDVTEQYVDLESRVKSKRTVEERLLEFMGKAEKTEDLLKISSDLAKVQEDIEVIVGKMKYLENQTSFSTVEMTMIENRVIIPALDNKKLDTWENTKKQLAMSTNFMLAAGSGLIVFLIGNMPIIILILLVAVGVYFMIKRSTKKKHGS